MTAIDYDAVIAELRKPGGWRKGDYGRWDKPDGAVCVLGACRRVASRSGLSPLAGERSVVTTLDGIVQNDYPDRASLVDTFNDHPDTTLDDVIAVVEKARAAEQVQP